MTTGHPRSGLLFKNRHDAGRRLAAEMVHRGFHPSLVLGITRGGVPVAVAVALALKVPMDILVVKKLRSPFQADLAFGAVCADGSQVLRQGLIEEFGIPESYVSAEIGRRLSEAKRSEERFKPGEPPVSLAGEAVAIVDDGMATGASMEVAIASAYRRNARIVIATVPVASPGACRSLSAGAEHVCCIGAPQDFASIDRFYLDFAAVPDDDVRRYLAEMRAVSAARVPRDR